MSVNPQSVQYLSLTTAPITGSIVSTDSLIAVVSGAVSQITYSDLTSKILGNIPTRLSTLESNGGGGGSGTPSAWPVARTLTLTGLVTGNATFDGSADFSLATAIADGALTTAKVSGLATSLLNLNNGITANTTSINALKPYGFINSGRVGAALRDIGPIFSANGGLSNAPNGNASVGVMGAVIKASDNNTVNGAIAIYGNAGSDNVYFGRMSGGNLDTGSWTWNQVWTAASFDPNQKFDRSGGSIAGNTIFGASANVFFGATTQFNGASKFLQGLQIFDAGNSARLLDVSGVADGSGGWDVRLSQTASVTGVKVWIDVPGHVFKVGTTYGVEYNDNQILHTGIFDPSSKLNASSPAVSAAKWTSPITFNLTGIVSGSASVDGSGNVSLTTSIPNGTLSIAMTSNLGTELASRIKTVNGKGPDGSGAVALTAADVSAMPATGGTLNAAGGSITNNLTIGGTLSVTGTSNLGATNVTGAVTATTTVSGARLFAGWDSGVAGSVSTNAWFRASGQTGLLLNDYSCGIYSTSSGIVRTYNGSSFVSEGRVSSNGYTAGTSATVGMRNNGNATAVAAGTSQLEAVSTDGYSAGVTLNRSGYASSSMWQNGANGTFNFGYNGSAHTTVSASGVWTVGDFQLSSDIRWKSQVVSQVVPRGRIEPKTYYNELLEQFEFGVIAQDIAQHWPELTGVKDDGSLTVSYAKLVAPLAVQVNFNEDRLVLVEQENYQLKEKNAQLESQLASILKRLSALEAEA